MSELKRHVGRITNTGAKILVVFRKVPGDESNCLVVESDRLPDMYHDNLMTIVGSREAQSEIEFYDVLHRRSFGDGRNCLTALHEDKLLHKVSIKLVEMMPFPSTPVALELINNEIDGPLEVEKDDQVTVDVVAGETQHTEQTAATDDPAAKAKSLVERAITMEQTAAVLKEEAYMLAPELRPGKGRPKLTADEAEDRKEERNKKRREKYAAQRTVAEKTGTSD